MADNQESGTATVSESGGAVDPTPAASKAEHGPLSRKGSLLSTKSLSKSKRSLKGSATRLSAGSKVPSTASLKSKIPSKKSLSEIPPIPLKGRISSDVLKGIEGTEGELPKNTEGDEKSDQVMLSDVPLGETTVPVGDPRPETEAAVTLVENPAPDGAIGADVDHLRDDTLIAALDNVQKDMRSSQILESGDVVDMVPEETDEDPAYASLQRELNNTPPPQSRGGFMFVRGGYDGEDDTPLIDLCTTLSRSESLSEFQENGVEEIQKVPMLRPSSPTQIEAEIESGTNAAISSQDVVLAESGQAGPPIDVPLAAAPVVDESMFEQAIDREAVIAQIRNVLDAKERLRSRNALLQNKLGEHFRRKRADESRDTEKSVTDQEQRYANCIAALKELRVDFDTLNTTNQKVESEHSARLEEKRYDTELKTQEFIRFKRQVALGAENTRTGKPLAPKLVEQMETNESRKEAEVVVVRLENIKLRNKLRRHEQLLRQKEELADGLHLIDFEQLKIENQTFNEKIEERNEELLKLRKKITNIVQVLTHVKEKLQFVQAEAVEHRLKLKEVDEEVIQMRDTLPLLKQERDHLRNSNVLLKQRNGLLGNERLLRDYENRVDEGVALNARMDQYRARHAEQSAETLAIKRNMQKACAQAVLPLGEW